MITGGKITNTELRKISHIGAKIVNEFVMSKKEGHTETKQTTETTEATDAKTGTKQTETTKEPVGFKLIDENGKKTTNTKKREA